MIEAVYKSIERYWIARAQVAEAERDALAEKLARARGALLDIGDGEPEWPNKPKKELEWCRRRARAALAAIKEGGE